MPSAKTKGQTASLSSQMQLRQKCADVLQGLQVLYHTRQALTTMACIMLSQPRCNSEFITEPREK